MPALNPTLVTTGLVKAFGRTRALNGVSLSIGAGEVLGIAGPNGSGKSTFGRIVAGFVRPDAGTTQVDNRPSHAFREANGVGFQPEETSRGWSSATVRGVISLFAGPARDLDADYTVAQLQLRALLDSRVRTISKGQWRLTLAACAIIRRSRLIVLDEPDAGLDPLALDCLGAAIRDVATSGSAVLILSHHLDEMTRIADRVAFMRRGKVVDEVRRGDLVFGQLRSRFAMLMSEHS